MCHFILSWRNFETFTVLEHLKSLLTNFPLGHECWKCTRKLSQLFQLKKEFPTNCVELEVWEVHVSIMPAVSNLPLDNRQIMAAFTASGIPQKNGNLKRTQLKFDSLWLLNFHFQHVEGLRETERAFYDILFSSTIIIQTITERSALHKNQPFSEIKRGQMQIADSLTFARRSLGTTKWIGFDFHETDFLIDARLNALYRKKTRETLLAAKP